MCEEQLRMDNFESVREGHSSDEIPPGYKKTEVGIIPEDWEVKRLRDCLVGQPEYGINASAVSYSENLPTYIRITDITDEGRFSSENIASVATDSYHNFLLTDGDVVFARTGASVGKYYRYRPGDGALVFAGFLIRVHPDRSKLLPQFLEAYLGTSPYWNWVRLMSARSGQPGINGKEYSILPVPVTSIAEQAAIAEVLTDVDNLIESLDNLIDKKQAIKKATMQQLLTGRTRLPGFEGEWELKQLGTFACVRSYRVFPASVNPETICIELEHIEQGTGRLCAYSKAAESESSKFLFFSGDILFGRLRPYLKKFWLAKQNGLCSTEIWPLNVSTSDILNNFLFYVVQTEQFLEASGVSYGTHMPRADWKVLRELLIAIPAIEEQRAITSILLDMDAEIEALERQRDKTKQIKQGMMQQLLTGRIRLLDKEAV
ncbi:MAG TPA: restriction endonuclease subunit S [Mesotoga infera]|mgnify:CR=1 FL=1|uniref:Restriction endonuclease subunit S n=1 Tax=Mesotoga infera TaxID=1236046 RepID=A0A7C1CUV0_9BACT|nr:restriction endonuclease subunit S [Mesotoga infera]